MIYVIAASLLITASTTAVLIFGSAWDEDLDLPVEGMMQTILHEQVPITPRRIVLLNLSVTVLIVMLGLVWCLPAQQALPLLGGLALTVSLVAWQAGCHHLLSLLRGR